MTEEFELSGASVGKLDDIDIEIDDAAGVHTTTRAFSEAHVDSPGSMNSPIPSPRSFSPTDGSPTTTACRRSGCRCSFAACCTDFTVTLRMLSRYASK